MEYFELRERLYNGTASAEEEQYYIDNYMSEAERIVGKPIFKMNDEDIINYQIASFNIRQGHKTGYDCPKCKNKGEIAVNKDGRVAIRRCDCFSIRKTMKLMEESGMGNLLNICSFYNFNIEEAWQETIYDKAREFVTDSKNWFYIGGNSGCGKTHLCTAMVKELLIQGMPVKYMLWLDESTTLKQEITNAHTYQPKMFEVKNSQVLYIDDFLKTGKNEEPTQADIKLAMEILNYRYNKARADKSKRWVTIISSERSISELMAYDEAIGSRIMEMAKDYCLYVAKDIDKNYRLK